MSPASNALMALTYEERHLFLLTMERHSSGAFQLLAQAMRRFDPINFKRQLAAFPELLEKYGPGTPFYQQTSIEHQQECSKDRAFFAQLLHAR